MYTIIIVITKVMKSVLIVLSVSLVVIIIIIGIFLWEKFKKKRVGVDCHKKSSWKWNKTCLFIEERFKDNTLKSPLNIKPVLTSFKYARGGGNSIFLPCWYRIRYVNVLTGGYSDFSDWTESPIMSGSCCLPCPDGVGICSSDVETGYESCGANQPSIGISSKESSYDPETSVGGKQIFINLHRYVAKSPHDFNKPDNDVTDQIVGTLQPGSYIDGVRYYEWTDVLFNPCSQGCSIPNWCKVNNKCDSNCPESL